LVKNLKKKNDFIKNLKYVLFLSKLLLKVFMDELLENFDSLGFSENEYKLLLEGYNEDDTETEIRYRRYLTSIDAWKLIGSDNREYDLEYIRNHIVMYLQGDTFYKKYIDHELLYYLNLL
jgi:hypothetical protein